jgi:serine/threonine protein kinase
LANSLAYRMEKLSSIKPLNEAWPPGDHGPRVLFTDLLAVGGQAQVFKGEIENSLKTEVVVKIFINEQDARREGAFLQLLKNPNIPSLHGRMSCFGKLGLVMEYIPGLNLRNWLNLSGARLDYPRFARALLQLLAYVHSLGIVHNDLSPDNIILNTHTGEPALIDFAAASFGPFLYPEPFGQSAYLAPEVLFGYATSFQADLYSLGASLFELITKERFFSENMNLGFQALKNTLSCQEHRKLFDVMKCLLAPHPGLRPSSAAVALRALEGPENLEHCPSPINLEQMASSEEHEFMGRSVDFVWSTSSEYAEN